MTAPNQSPPDGAFVIGGGDYKFGQDYTNEIVKQLFHVSFPTDLSSAVDILQEYLLKMPIEALRAFKDVIPGSIDDDFADVLTAVSTIIDNIQESPVFLLLNDFTSWVGALVQAITGAVGNLFDLEFWRTQLLSLGSLIPAQNIVGQISSAVLGLIPLSHIVDINRNLLENSNFDSNTGIVPANGWSWDGTQSFSGSGGSIKCVADGTDKTLFHKITIAVKAGEKLNISAKVKSSGLTGTGNMIRLRVVEYNDTTMGSTVEVASRAASASWVDLGGDYTVPGSGVNKLVLQLAVIGATAGSVFFDNLDAHKKEGILQEAITNLTNLISNLISAPAAVIGNIATVVVDAVGSTLQHVWDWLTHLFSGGRRNGAATNSPPVSSSTVSDVIDAADQVAVTTYNTSFSTDTLQGWFNQPRTLPSWLGVQADDVAFAQTLIDGTSTPTLGTMYLIPVKISQDRQIDAIKFGMSGSASMTNLYVGLYDVDESTGASTKVLDLGDVKSQLNLTYNLQTIDIPDPISVQAGELYYIAVLQTGGTAAAMHRWSSSTNFTTGQYPQWIGQFYTTTSIGALPSTFAYTDINSTTKWWGALGTAVDPVAAPTPQFYSDSSFAGSTTTNLGAKWTARYGGLYTKNLADYGTTKKPGVTLKGYSAYAKSAGPTVGVNSLVSRMGTEDHEVGIKFWPWAAGSSQTAGGIIGLRGNGSGSGVYLRVTYDKSGGTVSREARIYTMTSYSLGSTLNGGTSRASYSLGSTDPGTTTGGEIWEFRADGDVYTAYLNGVSVFSWTDTSGAVFPRYGNNTEVFIGAYSNSAIVDLMNFTAKDV